MGIVGANELNLITIETPTIENINKIISGQEKTKLRDEKQDDLKKLLKEYNDIFQGKGKLKDYEVKLYVNKDVQPVVQKTRRQPYHL